MSVNTVKKNCPFYDDVENCKKLQSKRNCYQCPVAEAEILRGDLERNYKKCRTLEIENQNLKTLLGEKVLGEYQEWLKYKAVKDIVYKASKD